MCVCVLSILPFDSLNPIRLSNNKSTEQHCVEFKIANLACTRERESICIRISMYICVVVSSDIGDIPRASPRVNAFESKGKRSMKAKLKLMIFARYVCYMFVIFALLLLLLLLLLVMVLNALCGCQRCCFRHSLLRYIHTVCVSAFAPWLVHLNLRARFFPFLFFFFFFFLRFFSE